MTSESKRTVAYMTVTEAAQEMGISERALHNRIKAGTVAAERFGARVWMIPETEVERLRGAGRMKPGPKPKEPTAAELHRDITAHQDALEEGRQRIRGETAEDDEIDQPDDLNEARRRIRGEL